MPSFENTQQNQGDEIAAEIQVELAEEDMEQSEATEYLYSQHISALLPQCPPAEATECDKECWRFTLDPITSSCFWPPKRRSPQRVASDDAQECSMWALSMYESEAQATRAYTLLAKSMRNIKKTIGDHLASGLVTCSDGKCMPANRKGHFDFHPYADADFANGFQVMRALP
ncbi:hypothetical protein HA47_11530 [Pantoea stewartii subsp. indologenes]|uniref:hypothetical protein n=1 Tax=Pantoea stewartii TaxID=66269 RepID=UPI00050EEB50|nr:hypothetical protein [Pantoea stewartii]KGD83548.1 hypothetical protein HA47_11530 [Pantoea stewartii subsp. indologenes]